MSTNCHTSRIIKAKPDIMIPKAMIVLPHGREIIYNPQLPISRLMQL